MESDLDDHVSNETITSKLKNRHDAVIGMHYLSQGRHISKTVIGCGDVIERVHILTVVVSWSE
jgi:hypothetical protein